MSEKMRVGKRIYNSMKLEAEKAEAKAIEARRIADLKRRNFEAVVWEGAEKSKAKLESQGNGET